MTAEDSLDKAVAEIVPLWVQVNTLIYLLFFVIEPFIVPAELLFTDLLIRGSCLAGGVMATIWIRREPIAHNNANKWALGLGTYVLLVSVLDLIFLQDPFFDLYLQFMLVGAGMVTLRYSTMCAYAALVIATWFATRQATGSEINFELSCLLFGALAIGLHSLGLRRRVVLDHWRRRETELNRQSELTEALAKAEEAKKLLDIEVAQTASNVTQALEALVTNREQRTELHRNLLHANRLSALGRLAAGLAHRLNNRLLVLLGTVDFLKAEEFAKDELEILDEVGNAAQRGAYLAEQLLPLTGKHHINQELVSVKELLEQYQGLLQRTAPHLKVENEVSDVTLSVDREAWFQIISNLIRNSAQVSLQSEPVILSITEQDSLIVFSVLDRGPGVPREFRERIFEPFFTTKSKTGGTGLGLSIVLGLTDQMGGKLSVNNRAGGGARFTVAFDKVRANSPTVVPDCSKPDNALFSGRRVLVVEDDAKVLKVLQRHLSELGLTVFTARDGSEGLQSYDEEPVNLLITDVVMPNTDGPTLAKELWRENSELKVLFTSGYSDARLSHSELLEDNYDFLAKPYTKEALGKKLEGILTSAG